MYVQLVCYSLVGHRKLCLFYLKSENPSFACGKWWWNYMCLFGEITVQISNYRPEPTLNFKYFVFWVKQMSSHIVSMRVNAFFFSPSDSLTICRWKLTRSFSLFKTPRRNCETCAQMTLGVHLPLFGQRAVITPFHNTFSPAWTHSCIHQTYVLKHFW